MYDIKLFAFFVVFVINMNRREIDRDWSAPQQLFAKYFYSRFSQFAQVPDHADSSLFHGLDLGLGCSTGTTDDSSGMAHSSAGRRGESRNKTNNRFANLPDNELSSVLLG